MTNNDRYEFPSLLINTITSIWLQNGVSVTILEKIFTKHIQNLLLSILMYCSKN